MAWTAKQTKLAPGTSEELRARVGSNVAMVGFSRIILRSLCPCGDGQYVL